MKINKLEGDVTMQIQALNHKFERRFDSVDSNIQDLRSNIRELRSLFDSRMRESDSGLRGLRLELLSTFKETTTEINKQHKENKIRLLWRLVFSVSLIFMFDIF